MAGFISKWYLGMGAMEVGQVWVVMLLMGSSLLNAAYFLPLVYRGWFAAPPPGGWPEEHHWPGQRLETHWMLLIPALFTAVLAVLAGLLAGSFFSPLGWTEFIVNREFGL